jgi:hypothetical protein
MNGCHKTGTPQSIGVRTSIAFGGGVSVENSSQNGLSFEEFLNSLMFNAFFT